MYPGYILAKILATYWLYTGYILSIYRYEHPVKGQGIYAYVTLMQDTEYSPELKKELVKTVRGHIGAFAAPDVIHWAPGKPPQLSIPPLSTPLTPRPLFFTPNTLEGKLGSKSTAKSIQKGPLYQRPSRSHKSP